MPTSLPNLPTNHSGKLFGIAYIILTGVIDTILPVASLWSWVEKSASYLLKLAPFLWWALPAKNLAQVTPENKGPAFKDWIPDNFCFCSYTVTALLELGADQILVNSSFVDKFKLTTNPLGIKSMVLADEHHIAVTRETSPFSIMLENLNSTIQGQDIDFPKFDIVLGLDWLQSNKPSCRLGNLSIDHQTQMCQSSVLP
ncbi:hypothetical protein DSO57_1006472 [Entomophthora muscae]|uniref:Uncharacterized protein n=1 Tax=Entomophthora muscae TaxID=34485 RepID=A0ACC2RMM5_9FUNG|nr:hypothetical protein DSO57_1006472 [Entomophthora muscae]